MKPRTFELPDEIRLGAQAFGTAGEQWAAKLGLSVKREMEFIC